MGVRTRRSARAVVTVLIAAGAVATMGTVVGQEAGASSFPGVNGKLVYLSNGELWTVNPDGSSAAQLTTGFGVDYFDVSPNGRAVAFSAGPSQLTPDDIYIVNINGPMVNPASSRLFIPTRSWRSLFDGAHGPTWSPDGSKLAFYADSYQTPNHLIHQLWTINVNGTTPKQLTNWTTTLGGGVREPAWSPAVNGNIIFRVSNTIYYVAPTAVYTDISAVHLLYEEGANIGHFSWKPDGSSFAYRRGSNAVYEMTSAGDRHSVLDPALEGGNGAVDPTWSPDGTKLAYSWSDQLYTVPADRIPHGAAPVAVTSYFQAKTSPGWAIVPAGDTTPPTISIASGPSGTVTATTAKFKFSGSEPLVTFFCKLDGALPKACPAASTISALSQGMHTLTVYGSDLAGNASEPLTRTWTVSSIRITRIVYRASTLNGETISLKNLASTAVPLGSWKITSSSAGYTVPTFSLGAGTTVTVHTGNGTKTGTNLYMGRTTQFWSNTKSTGQLKRADATIADTCSYNSATASATNC